VLNETGVVSGVDVKVMELTGEPGDAFLTDLRVLHSGAANAAHHPRIMVTHRFVRADLVPELAEAYGWR
jgi:ectoine hydroxylase-related dioxygenase (phytanoyl-CoA dioxygenase family)